MTIRTLIGGLKPGNGKKAAAKARRKARTKKSEPRRFIVTYEAVSDPPDEEVRALRSGLKGLKVVAEMPGTVLVEGAPDKVREAVAPLDHWSCAPEGQFSS